MTRHRSHDATFRAQLFRAPFDTDLRGIYADWLEDQGRDQEAAAQRWIATRLLGRRSDSGKMS